MAGLTNAATPRAVVLPLDYHAMRLLLLRRALFDLLRRWSLYLAILVLLFSAGSNAPLRIAVAMASVLVWPLRHASAEGWTVVPATIVYALVGTLPVLSTRPLWWPRRWAAAERALPIPYALIHRSDRFFALLLMAPWQALLMLGAIGIWADGAASPHTASALDTRWSDAIALLGWAVSATGSLYLSLLWMRAARNMRGSGARRGSTTTSQASRPIRSRRSARDPSIAIPRLGFRSALVALPLLRGRAKRSGSALAASVTIVIAATGAAWWAGIDLSWLLAANALVSVCSTSILRVATRRECVPLWQASPSLPLDNAACERTRLLVVVTPTIVALFACFVCAATAPFGIRAPVLVAYGLVVAAGALAEALTPLALHAHHHATRWLFGLVVAMACASEIAPA